MPRDSNFGTYQDRTRFRCTWDLACYALWLVLVEGLSQTHAGLFLQVSPTTVNRVVRGKRFPDAYPVPPPRLSAR